MPATRADLLARLRGSGQEHVLDAYDTLSKEKQLALTHQITHCAHDFAHLNTVLSMSLQELDNPDSAASAVRPPPSEHVWQVSATLGDDVTQHHASDLWRLGLEKIAEGKTAVLMMAGGSGTRLGVTIPKGLFVCDRLPRHKSLFEMDCEKIVRTQLLAAAAFPTVDPSTIRIPLLIMTSEENDAATRRFFTENDFFGLVESQVLFFKQSSLPCYDEATGKILMASDGTMCVAPGGNGGLYQALAHTHQPSGRTTLAELEARGVEQVQIFSVDNALARIADPLFFGYAFREAAHVVVKTVAKTGPAERVGVFAQRADSGEWVVVEYTEIGTARAEMRDPVTGELAFNCGNIASHCCSVQFLAYAAEKMKTSTQYHAARKQVATRDGPRMAVKLEAFIFDVFQYCNADALQDEQSRCEGDASSASPRDRFRLMQVKREEEFAPIKNADTAATDNATTAAHLVLRLHTHWTQSALRAAQAGHGQMNNSTLYAGALATLERGEVQVEISPLVSLQGEDLGRHANAIAAQIVRARLDSASHAEGAVATALVPVTWPMPAVTDEATLIEQLAHM